MKIRRNTAILVLVTAGVVGGAGAATLARLGQVPEGVIQEGVHVAGIDLGRKTVEAARTELEGWARTRQAEPLTLTATGTARVWKPSRSELGASVDVDATLRGTLAVGERESTLARLAAWFSGRKGVNVSPVWKVDRQQVARYLKKRVGPSLSQSPKSARFVALDEGFRIEPEHAGRALDLDAAIDATAARAGSLSADPVELPVKVKPPHVAAADLKGIEGEVARFRTHYSERGNRAKNIKVACSRINGTVLKPGDRFSYNEVVGPREPEAGFKVAPVIIKGKLQPGMGGGVCQVSTTLYNAVLLSNLKIVRREHHAFPVHYVPAGRDATVAYGSIDFQFENDTDGPVAIAASGEKQQVVMRVFGRPAPNRRVILERVGISSWGQGAEVTHDASLPAGKRVVVDKGHAGRRVTLIRKVKVDGKVVKRETISRDVYRAFPTIVTVGTRAPKVRPGAGSAATPATPASSAGGQTAAGGTSIQR